MGGAGTTGKIWKNYIDCFILAMCRVDPRQTATNPWNAALQNPHSSQLLNKRKRMQSNFTFTRLAFGFLYALTNESTVHSLLTLVHLLQSETESWVQTGPTKLGPANSWDRNTEGPVPTTIRFGRTCQIYTSWMILHRNGSGMADKDHQRIWFINNINDIEDEALTEFLGQRLFIDTICLSSMWTSALEFLFSKKNAYDPAKTTIALYNDDDIRRSFPFEMVPFSAKHSFIWVFPKIRVPQNGWFIMKNPYKNGWFGGPTPIFGNTHFRVALKKTKHRKGTWIQPSKLCISPLCVIWSKMPGDVFLLSRGDEETLPSKATCDRSSDHQKRDVWYTKAPKKKTEMRV